MPPRKNQDFLDAIFQKVNREKPGPKPKEKKPSKKFFEDPDPEKEALLKKEKAKEEADAVISRDPSAGKIELCRQRMSALLSAPDDGDETPFTR